MRRLASLIALLVLPWAHPAVAQDDRGYLEVFLEDNLSDAGREVRITGFEGALSARATIQELTITDDAGVWLTLKGAVLDWNRGALLRGRLEIAELSATEILLPRLPNSTEPVETGTAAPRVPNLPAAEAAGFSLPELPVSIDIGSMSIGSVSLGKALFGEAATIAVAGSASLEGGEGRAALAIKRIDAGQGELTLAAGFANATRNLNLNFRLVEAANGIAANLIGLPDRPSVDLQITGNGTPEDFAADISLKTGGAENLSGKVTLSVPPDVSAPARMFSAELGGDLRPLVLPQYRDFLGPDTRLAARGQRTSSGQLRIDDMTLSTQEARLTGRLELDSDYWPRRFALDGRIAGASGGDVLLSVPGIETRLGLALLTMRYDAAESDAWTADLSVKGLRRDDISVTNLQVSGGGSLMRGDGAPVGALTGRIDLSASGIAARDTALTQAVGPSLAGSIRFDWQEDRPLEVPEFRLSGSDYSVSGDVVLQGLRDRLNLRASGGFDLAAQDLSRFSGLVGQPLAGAAKLRIAGAGAILGGAFDLRLDGAARDLGFGVPQLDVLLAGGSTLDASVRRDATGTRIERLRVNAPGAGITASGDLKTGASSLRFDLRLPDAAPIAAGLDGPAAFAGVARQAGDDWALEAAFTGPGGVDARLDGSVAIIGNRIGPVSGVATVKAGDLTPYRALAGREIGGAVQLTADGQADLQRGTFAASLTGSAQDTQVGMTEADRLLRGESRIAVEMRREGNGITVFDRLDLTTPQLIADLTGSVSPAKSRLRFNLDLRDIGLYAPGLNGPVAAEGVAASAGAGWDVQARLQGPGGTAVNAVGQVAPDAASASMTFAGTAPLALANLYIAPNLASGSVAFDLSLSGPISLAALSGSVRTEAAGFTAPGQRIALGAIAATAQIAAGRAQIEASSSVASGGRLTVFGPVGLSAPFPADLDIVLGNVAVSEPGLYATSVDGSLSVRGPLTGAAAIAGALSLGPVEIRVPDTGGSATGQLPGLQHRNAPPAVRETLGRAGLLESDVSRSGSVAYPLDLTISAPSRIFVRGRGLDAELGGQLRLSGSTANVITEGRFDLIRGRLDILGKRLALSEGFAQLQGDFDPYIRVVADADNAGTRIRIVIEGLASAPQISLSSNPDLPEDEIVSRLLFGRDLSQISPLQALRIASAINTLTGGGGGGIVNRLRQNFGLDDLDVTTDETGATALRAGKYISDNAYTDVTMDSAGKSEINLNLSITPSLSARGTLGSDGNSGLGLFFEKDY